jgi:hypothetical protein
MRQRQLHNMACDCVFVVFILFVFLAYMLNVTQCFDICIIPYANVYFVYMYVSIYVCEERLCVGCELRYCRHNRDKGNVLFFGVYFSCVRLRLEILCIVLDKVKFVIDYVLKPLWTRKIHVWVHGSVWLAARLVASL